MERAPIVELKKVSCSFGRLLAVEDVDLVVGERDFLGIIGPNGGGKTTILRIILGLVEPDRGSVRVFGGPPSAGRRRIGYVPQLFDVDLAFPASVTDVVLMGRLGHAPLGRRYGRADLDAAGEAIGRVGMSDRADRAIGELSGGERQRALIARALAADPELLILDEPASSIDSRWQAAFFSMLRELNDRMAIILVTHDVTALSAYVEQVACLNRRLYYHGSTAEGIEHLVETYECPIEIIAHGVPHRVLGDHE
ncbi:MAG: ABC transporter ATP-binding protein [Candidatus Krumholzibacteriota bacterium]|nr:ABC transporter ATP-binding protein [Candidatus Krumholzibacteriota bacterium]